MKRAIFAMIVAVAGAALAQSVSSTPAPVGTADAGFAAQNAPFGGDGGTTNNANPSSPNLQQQPIYSFDPPPVGSYSFTVNGSTSR